MIEAFERNLRLQKIKLKVENAETEEELVQIFEEYLESKKPKETKPTSIVDGYYDAKYREMIKEYASNITTNPVFLIDQEGNYHQAKKTPLNLVVYSEIDGDKLHTFPPQEHKLIVEREKKHLEHMLLEELVRGNHIEHTVVSDSHTDKVRLRARLRG